MKKNKKFLLENERGGMLVELMLTLAITAIMIPFLFRYQQNAVERANNIAVARRMEIVQSALEKYIVKYRSEYINGSDNSITEVSFQNIAPFLPYGFLDDNNVDDYSLRVLKRSGNNNNAILQGIVFLSNNMPLQTRQIANLGGGKIGYTDDYGNVFGGFNVFTTTKANVGVGEQSGLVGTTAISANDTEYLWRMGSDFEDSASNATMHKDLDLGTQNVVNVNETTVDQAQFALSLNADTVNVGNTLYFFNKLNFSTEGSAPYISGGDAQINGALYGAYGGSNKTVFSVHNTLTVDTDSQFMALTYEGPGETTSAGCSMSATSSPCFHVNAMPSISNLKEFVMGDSSKPIRRFTVFGDLSINKLTNQNGIIIKGHSFTDFKFAGVVPVLSVGKRIMSLDGKANYFWDVGDNSKKVLQLHNVSLRNLNKALNVAYGKLYKNNGELITLLNQTGNSGDGIFGLYSTEFLGNLRTEGDTKITDVLQKLCKVKQTIGYKYQCLKEEDWSQTCKKIKAGTIPFNTFNCP